MCMLVSRNPKSSCPLWLNNPGMSSGLSMVSLQHSGFVRLVECTQRFRESAGARPAVRHKVATGRCSFGGREREREGERGRERGRERERESETEGVREKHRPGTPARGAPGGRQPDGHCGDHLRAPWRARRCETLCHCGDHLPAPWRAQARAAPDLLYQFPSLDY